MSTSKDLFLGDTQGESRVTAVKPRVGLRVRRTSPHKEISIGMLGTIDVAHTDGVNFWVRTDGGGFNGWATFAEWTPVGEGAA